MKKQVVTQNELEYNEILRQAVALLPWGHILQLMRTVKDDNQVLFYATECISKGWTRDLLLNAVKMQMYESVIAPQGTTAKGFDRRGSCI